jgi:hypothetical protein
VLAVLLALTAFQPDPAFEVPFKLGDNAIIVAAVVNGHPLSLMFDSGFGGSLIVDDNLSIGPASGSKHLRDFVGEYSAQTVKITSLALGGHRIKLEDDQAVQQPGGRLTTIYNTHTDGILGLQAIEDYVTQINFQNLKIRFYPKTFDISGRAPDNKVTFRSRLLPLGADSLNIFAVTSDGQKMILALDTGNSFYATVNRDVLERVGLWRTTDKPLFPSVAMVASGPVKTWVKRMSNLTIFGVPVASSYWEVIDLPSSDARGDGTVGIDFLKNFNITIDYDRRLIWLENFNGRRENLPPAEVGMVLRYSNEYGSLRVISVTPGGPADEAGIKRGDSILEIDGAEALSSWSPREIESRMRGAEGAAVRLSVSHQGTVKQYELVRKALYNN